MPARPKIMIVDDSILTIQWVCWALESVADVVGVPSAMEASAAAAREKPDLLILDMLMPVLDGDRIIEALRTAVPGHHLPVVLFSSMAADELADRAMRCGADTYLCKDGDAASFRERILACVASAGNARVARKSSVTQRTENLARVVAPATATTVRGILVAGRVDSLTRDALLARCEFALIEVRTAAEAMQRIILSKACLVVTGPDLPDQTAIELTHRIRADPHIKHVSILAIEPDGDTKRAALLTASGANKVLLAPVEVADLREAIAALTSVAPRRNARLLVRITVEMTTAQGTESVGNTHNISRTGMLLDVHQQTSVGTELALSFFLPGRKHAIRVTGKVVRLHRYDGDNPIMGVRFVGLSTEDGHALEDFVRAGRKSADGD